MARTSAVRNGRPTVRVPLYCRISTSHRATLRAPGEEGWEANMKVVPVAGGRDYPSQGRVFEILNEENPQLVMHCCAKGADTWASRWVVEHTRLELRCPPDWGGYGAAADSRRNRMMLALLSTFAVAGDDVTVVVFPDARTRRISCKRRGIGPLRCARSRSEHVRAYLPSPAGLD